MPNASYPSVLGSSIQTAEVDDSSITLPKLADGTALKYIGFDAAGAPAEKDAPIAELLDTHTTSGSEASHTYTPAAELLFADYAYFLVCFDGKLSASAHLEIVVSALGANHGNKGIAIDGALAFVNTGNTDTGIHMADTTLINGADCEVHGITRITSGGLNNRVVGTSFAHGSVNNIVEYMTGMNIATTKTGVTSLKIQVTAGNFVDGSLITMYGVRRA